MDNNGDSSTLMSIIGPVTDDYVVTSGRTNLMSDRGKLYFLASEGEWNVAQVKMK